MSLVSTPASYVGGYLYYNVSLSTPFYASFLLDTLGTAMILVLLKPQEKEKT
ncbi:MAG: hypothetical protein NWE89_15810 [Candidatus Bathyarchaeota archaeon]|nr:hypothetical protein [Candidatus Bathyarchaeota archaeon]